jgi:hypothetical protein
MKSLSSAVKMTFRVRSFGISLPGGCLASIVTRPKGHAGTWLHVTPICGLRRRRIHHRQHFWRGLRIESRRFLDPVARDVVARDRLPLFAFVMPMAGSFPRFLPREWPLLEWPLFEALVKCGQSLEVFCTGVFLAVGAHVVLVEVSRAVWIQIVVSVVGIGLMSPVAYYRSWSKTGNKKPPPSSANAGG